MPEEVSEKERGKELPLVNDDGRSVADGFAHLREQTWGSSGIGSIEKEKFVPGGSADRLLPGLSIDFSKGQNPPDKNKSGELSEASQKRFDYARDHQELSKVPPGANLYGICKEHLAGKGEKTNQASVWNEVQRVARLNGISDPDLIRAGAKLKLEDPASLNKFQAALKADDLANGRQAKPVSRIDSKAFGPSEPAEGKKEEAVSQDKALPATIPTPKEKPENRTKEIDSIEQSVDPKIEEIDKKYPFNVDSLKVNCRYDAIFKESKEIFKQKQEAGLAPSEMQLLAQAKAAAVPGQRFFEASVPYWNSKDGREAVGENYMWDANGKLISRNYWRRGGGDQLGQGKDTTIYHNIEGVNAGGSDIGWINQSRNEALIARGGNPPIDMHGRSLSSGTSAGCEAHPSGNDYPNWMNFREKMHHAIKDNQERGLRPFASLHVGTAYAVKSDMNENLDKYRLNPDSKSELVTAPDPVRMDKTPKLDKGAGIQTGKKAATPRDTGEGSKEKLSNEQSSLTDTRLWSDAQKRMVAAAETSVGEKMWRYGGWSDDSVDGGNLGCAGSVSGVLKLAGYKGELSAGANELGRILQKEGNWSKICQKEDLRNGRLQSGDIRPGDVIVWQPGDYGHGHIGTVVPGKAPGLKELEYMKANAVTEVKSSSQSFNDIARKELKSRNEKTDYEYVKAEAQRIAELNGMKSTDKLKKGDSIKVYDDKFISEFQSSLPQRAAAAGPLAGLDFVHNSSGKCQAVKESLENRLKDGRNWYLIRPPALLSIPEPAAMQSESSNKSQSRMVDATQQKRVEDKFEQFRLAMSRSEDSMNMIARKEEEQKLAQIKQSANSAPFAEYLKKQDRSGDVRRNLPDIIALAI